MTSNNKTGIKELIFILLFFGLALLTIGALLKDRIESFVWSYTENQTKKQAESFALLAAEELRTDIENLSYIASLIDAEAPEKELRANAPTYVKDQMTGLLSLDGHAVYGEALSPSVFDGIQASFRGNNAITYVKNEGLLFTCPVFHGVNIKYVLYRLYPTASIEKHFSIKIYDDLGKLCVSTRDGEILIPFSDISKDMLAWFKSDDATLRYSSLDRDMEVSVACAKRFATAKGGQVLFEAEVPETDYIVMGFVPEKVAANGIHGVSILIMWVFGLLMLLVLIGAVYLVNANLKLRESAELRRAKAQAEEASRAKSDFLANMSHEIRTPINTVLGMNEMVLRESADPAVLAYSENIKSAGSTLLGLINDILDFSKIEAGKIEIIPVEYDLAIVLSELCNALRTRAEDKGLMFIPQFDRKTPRHLYGDDVRIKEVLTNLLTNAIKYTQWGSVTFKLDSEKTNDKDTILLRIAVVDTGAGIRPEDLEKLFSEFVRLEEKKNRNIEGTGLGLNITKSLLELMGSSLEVESTYGEGTTFSFALKQRILDAEPLGDYEKVYEEVSRNREKYKEKFSAPDAEVLVVDDNPMNLMVFKSLIKRTQIQTDTASSGDEGIACTMAKKYDVIFLDHMMPMKDGIETLSEIRAASDNPNRETPTICLTANAISGARDEYIRAGFDDYLTKPIDPELLEEMLYALLPKEKLRAQGEENGFSQEKPDSSIPAELKELSDASIDVQKGLKNSGSREAYLPLLKVFYESIDEKKNELDAFYAAEDYANYTIKVHALKSSAAIIGATDFAEQALKLETAGKSGDYTYIQRTHPSFMEEYIRFKAPLEKLFGQEAQNEESDFKPVIDLSLIEEVYFDLAQSAEDMDCDRIEEIFAEIGEYAIPDSEKPLWKKLKEASMQYDYDAIIDLLEKKWSS